MGRYLGVEGRESECPEAMGSDEDAGVSKEANVQALQG